MESARGMTISVMLLIVTTIDIWLLFTRLIVDNASVLADSGYLSGYLW